MFDDLLTRNVTIQTASTTVDRYNNTILDWTAPTETPAKAWIAQLKKRSFGAEDFTQRDAVTTSLIAFFSPDTPITAYDRVVFDGAAYDVDGAPDIAWTPAGAHHIEVHLGLLAG